MGFRFRRVDTAERARAVGAALLLILPLSLSLPAAAADPPAPAPEPAAGPAPDPDPPVRKVGPVTVTATRGEREVLDVAGNVTVLEREDIERSGAPTIPELLRRQPGLFVTSTTTNPAGVQVEARGFNNGGALGSGLVVQVDGRRVNEADTGSTDWALLPLDQVESIEIVRGPASAIYGDNAVGGVINIRTRAQEGPPRATVTGRIGRYQTGGGSFNAAGSAGPVTASLFVNGLTTDAYRDRAAFSNEDVTGTLEWDVTDRVRIGARGGWYEDFREFPGAVTQAEIDANGRRAADPGNLADEADIESAFTHWWLEAVLADDVQLRVQPYYKNRSDDVTITAMTFGSTDIDTDKESVGTDAQLRIDCPLGSLENRFIAGFEYLYETTDRLVASGFGAQRSDNDRNLFSGYLQEEIHLLDDLLVSAGVRFDHGLYDLRISVPDTAEVATDEPRFSVWSPRASITYRVRPSSSVYVSYSRGFRLPNFDEDAPLLGFPPGSPPTIPDLDPQISDAVEIGAKHRGDRLGASIALFWMDVQDEILFDPFTFSNTNLDRTRHQGIETAVDVRILSWLWGYANYTLDDVKILDAAEPLEGERMPITPLHRGSFGLLARLPWNVEVGANVNVVDARILANDFDRELERLDPHAVLDLLLAWRPSLGEHVSGALTFALRNAAGEKYDDFGARFDVFDAGSGTFVPTAFFNPAATRTWEVGMSLTLRM
jgi:iron complex outermembrane receptor protein